MGFSLVLLSDLSQPAPGGHELLDCCWRRQILPVIAALLICSLINTLDSVVAQHREPAAEFLELLTAQHGFEFRLAGHDRSLSDSPFVRHERCPASSDRFTSALNSVCRLP